MKKLLVFVALLSLLLPGCNRTLVDTTWAYKYADINGVGTVEVSSWTDYENSDMIQIKASDGTVYLTHSVNVVLRTK
ncbi:hypothetical protein [Oribacterium sp. WCC10]|uniref:hypothetical protein n=1 Tax=Oribacterium sp. WCC10 TaxID=1855343 RepID=UPI0008E1DACF|nr:hypothetical protein [Oribacterium sp. WCC10]SFG79021.1 hypothetical protein SAMN05216356_12925 [Oribacterium sp. WCC10]